MLYFVQSLKLSDATVAFAEINAKSVSIYQNVTSLSKDFHFADVELKNNSKNESAVLAVYVVVGQDYIQELVEGDWIWGFGFGKCDGTSQGFDATDVIEYTLKHCGDFPYTLSQNEFFVSITQHASTEKYFFSIEDGYTVDLPQPCILEEDLEDQIKWAVDNIHSIEKNHSKKLVDVHLEEFYMYPFEEDNTAKWHHYFLHLARIVN